MSEKEYRQIVDEAKNLAAMFDVSLEAALLLIVAYNVRALHWHYDQLQKQLHKP